jgi:hypothetical protein
VRRLGRVMRWGVYALTILCMTLFPVSFLWSPGVMLSGVGQPSGELVQAYTLGVDDGRLLIRTFQPTRYSWSGSVDQGTDWEFGNRIDGPMWWDASPWWDRPRVWKDPGFPTMLDVPLVYLSFFMLFVCGLIWLIDLRGFVVRYRCNLCVACGYSLKGLTNSTCPECGTRITHD